MAATAARRAAGRPDHARAGWRSAAGRPCVVAEQARPYTYQTAEGDQTRAIVVVPREDGRYDVTIDGTTRVVDARATGRHTLSLLLDGAQHEVHLAAKADTWT